MIQLRTLGSTELSRPDGTAAASVLAQPKRLALLVYLAVASPRGFHRRDTLLAMFWPESDSARARGSLRQALRFLRQSLGRDVIVNRGEDEIGIGAGTLECDVVAFESALDAGDAAAALELCRGPLLDGFFVDASPQWERWLDGERERLRRLAVTAAGRLTDAAARRRDIAGAVEWARVAAGHGPDDETAVRQLIVLLDQAGDRAGALSAYDAFAARLAGEYELTPSPETAAVVSALRERGSAAAEARTDAPLTTASAPAASVPADPAPTAQTPANAPTAQTPANAPTAQTSELPELGMGSAATPAGGEPSPPRARFDRVRMLAAAAFVIVVLGLAGHALLPGRAAPAAELRVLVTPFENMTGSRELDPLGYMAADWVTQGMAGVGLIEVVPLPTALASARHFAAGADGVGPPTVWLADGAALRAVGRETGARLFVTGTYYRQRDTVHFQARIADAASGRVLGAIQPISAPVSTPLHGVEQLTARILAVMAPLTRAEMHARSLLPPPTYEAYREYIAGVEAFVRRDVEAAVRHYERAAVHDSTYPMPLLGLAILYSNLGQDARSDSLAQHVARYRHRLGPMESNTLALVLAWLDGDDQAGYEAVVRQARIAPGTLAHYQVAEQARRLNRPRETIRVLREIGPERGELRGWRAYWRELTWAHHMLGEHRAELRAARRARGFYPDDPEALLFEIVALAAAGRTRSVDERLLERLASRSDAGPSTGVLMRLAGQELIAHGQSAAGAALLDRSVAWYESRPAADRERLRFGHAVSLYVAGAWDESRALLLELETEYPNSIGVHAYLGALAARRGDRDEAERISEWLLRPGVKYLRGEHTYARARIAALLGEREHAVSLLGEAFSQGLQHSPVFHREQDLASLRGYPPFEALMRPR
jgi:DNA-binding SARP family transcriptional activator/TolB-like protein